MRYVIASSFLAIAAVQAVPQSLFPFLNIPSIPVLPLQGVPDVLSGNGFNSIALTLTDAAQQLGVSSDLVAVANAQLSGGITVDPTPYFETTLELLKALHGTSDTFWQLAYNLQNKTCSIAASINKQNIAAQQANLVVAIQAQLSAVVKLQQNIAATVAAIKKQTSAFSDAEKAILTTAIQATSAAILASDAPLTVLLAGLKTIGVNAITEAANNLEAQVNAFAGFASKVNFVPVSV